MKERPILFSTEMVKAIIEGRKTMTRRIFKDHPRLSSDVSKIDLKQWFNDYRELILSYSPYGQSGDILWVRENTLIPPVVTEKMLRDGADTWPEIDYQASCSETEIDQYKSWAWKLKPSIHMPKSDARIWLEITDIKVERLQDITEEDAIVEGLKKAEMEYCWVRYDVPKNSRNTILVTANPIVAFATLWQSINGPDSWLANPWVWVISFKVLSTFGKAEFINH